MLESHAGSISILSISKKSTFFVSLRDCTCIFLTCYSKRHEPEKDMKLQSPSESGSTIR